MTSDVLVEKCLGFISTNPGCTTFDICDFAGINLELYDLCNLLDQLKGGNQILCTKCPQTLRDFWFMPTDALLPDALALKHYGRLLHAKHTKRPRYDFDHVSQTKCDFGLCNHQHGTVLASTPRNVPIVNENPKRDIGCNVL